MPLNIALVIDRSGSMDGTGPTGTNKMQDAKKAAKALLEQLTEGDRFTVLSFDDGAEVLASGPGIPARIAEAKRRIDRLSARGGTDMVSGLRDGIAQAKNAYAANRSNRVILISDGVPNTQDGLVEMARGATSLGINVTTIGVGTDYNEDLMSSLADAGAGNYYFINDAKALAGVLKKELDQAMAVVGREAVLKVTFAPALTPVKVYGYDAQVIADQAIVSLGDVFGGQTAEVVLKVHHARLEGTRPIASIELSYFDALNKTTQRSKNELSAAFVADAKQVAASLDKETAMKVEKIAAADVLKAAMEQLKAGKRDEAAKMIQAERARNVVATKELDAPAEATGGDVLAEFEEELNAPPAVAPATVKEGKAKARALAR
jgi:Ca-activated chloride channel family protein